jgi:hypothetical protein
MWCCCGAQLGPEDLLALALAIRVATNTVTGGAAYQNAADQGLGSIGRGAGAGLLTSALKGALGAGAAAASGLASSVFGTSDLAAELIDRGMSVFTDNAEARIDGVYEGAVEGAVAAHRGLGQGQGPPLDQSWADSGGLAQTVKDVTERAILGIATALKGVNARRYE